MLLVQHVPAWCEQVRLASVAENSFNAVERISEFCDLPQEAPEEIRGSKPDDWPDKGRVSPLNNSCTYPAAWLSAMVACGGIPKPAWRILHACEVCCRRVLLSNPSTPAASARTPVCPEACEAIKTLDIVIVQITCSKVACGAGGVQLRADALPGRPAAGSQGPDRGTSSAPYYV